MASTNEIRSSFIDYFKKLDHTIVEASSLVPRNDPTLLFTNSGMVQYKNFFTGAETPPYSRAVSAQKCIRVGGKHNDLDNVGFTARHHTFFEMLGNFSFGDYFKEFVIEHAWDLLVRQYGIPAERLLVTIYADDDEAFELWRKISGLPEHKIIRISTDDNFWRMGDLGPCGPSSEIFYDHGDHIAGGPPGSEDQDGDRFVEIWNLVFMQYDQKTLEEMVTLPKSCIDSGMGIERLAAILQGKSDNYDTDILRNLVLRSSELTGVDPDGAMKASHRVVADHLRSSAFLIADGVMPSNEGRGYVLRRIMRRAMRHANLLGAKEPIMHQLVPALVGQMGGHYSELNRSEQLIKETLRTEETNFHKTLDRGLALLEDETERLGANQQLPGDVAFKLYDTFGFPLDLMQDALRNRKVTVDVAGFDKAMAEQRSKARGAWKGSGDVATDQVWFDIKEKSGVTEFLGYETEGAEGEVVAILKGGVLVENAKIGDSITIVLNQTPFYAESGGQIGDKGTIQSFSGFEMQVNDTQKKLDSLNLHVGVISKGSVKTEDIVSLKVASDLRADIRANHSATHLLHAALRRQLGESVTQRGSLVTSDRLRFDISYPRALTTEDVVSIEREVNEQIRLNTKVDTRIMSADEAQNVGAMALFDEKYGSDVRVVLMGSGKGPNNSYSAELCGGTHVKRTGDIGLLKVVSESALGSNVRRIEAVTGRGALVYVDEGERLLKEIANHLSTNRGDTVSRVSRITTELKDAQRDIQSLKQRMATGDIGSATSQVREFNGVKTIGKVVDEMSAKELRSISDEMLKQIGSGVIVLASATDEGRAALLVRVTKDLAEEMNAVKLIKAGTAFVGGGAGGGRSDLAQSGGPKGEGVGEAVDAILRSIEDTANIKRN